MSTPEPTAVYVDGYRGAEVADSIVAHSPKGTVHALRPAADHYLVSVADALLVVPAVTLARRLVGATDERGRWVVPAAVAGPLLEGIQSAAEGEPSNLLSLIVNEMQHPTTPGDDVATNQKESTNV